MIFVFSKHALEQIKNRNIPENSVRDIIENPDKIIDYDKCIKIYQSIYKTDRKFLMRVFINCCKEPMVIITVYKTSKIEKYHES
ncbi:MAG: DUF4258 domain-containing protein [Bacteroidales bacterium]|nr:DUF4258 domain-containing protein [Bacteroidales bacterium]